MSAASSNGATSIMSSCSASASLVMRGAGCTFNDIVDRKIDAQVARTRGRPIPSGAVTVTGAVVFLIVQCLLGLGGPAAVQLVRGGVWARPRCCWSPPILS